ncbi:TPA: restriction endonuclease subunit S [Vibrio vulnificus]
MSKAAMSGKYAAYPEYKDSGVEWLGEIPAHWKTCRLKHLASIKNGQDYKAVQSEVGYPVMGSGGQFAFATEFMYDRPSVLLGRKGTIDKPLYINEPFWTVDTMYYTEMQPETDAKYLYYLATTIQFARYSTNTALPSMTQEHLGNYIFAVPVEVSDRTQIANFLDHETAKIDTLIEKQQQLIKLLKEKRQAVISHAVTKGLNPQAPMKDSCVEWLGEVPEHWGIATAIKHISSLKGRLGWQGLKADEYQEEGPYVVSSAHFSDNKIMWEKCPRVSLERYKLDSNIQLAEGDILLMKDGAAMGKMAYVDQLPDKACLNSHLLLFRPLEVGGKPTYDTTFMFYFMLSNLFQGFVKNNGTGATFFGISQQSIGNYRVCFPPLEEQRTIALYLTHSLNKLERLEEAQRQMVRLLQERRTALISAAVTGKIDVRNWQAPMPQEQAFVQTA